MPTKVCFECHETKPAEDFYPHPRHRDGLSTRCRPCTLLDEHRRWRSKHPEPAPYAAPTEKLCNRCGTVKPMDEFHRYAKRRDGRQVFCKACSTDVTLSGYRNDPAKHAAYNREWARKNPNAKADIALKTRLGLPHGTYARMFAAQDGKCAICGDAHPGARTKRFHVDHDAATGAVRGLLCGRCNTGIGQLRHDEVILRAAIDYLAKRPVV